MQIQFLGATGTVTGSKYLLTVDKKNILVDCGLFQGLKLLRLRNWQKLPVDAKKIEAVILTHAHIDHSGYIPLLVKNGFRGKIYATGATRALCGILLPDSGHLQEEDADFANRHKFSKHSPALPLYTELEAHASLKFFESVAWGKKTVLSRKASFEFQPVGHILGAGIVRVSDSRQTITFSGDLGRPKDPIMNPPVSVRETDYLVVESTYGDRSHPEEDPKQILKDIINRTLQRGGILLIPAFAVGRAQQVLHLLSELKKKDEIPDVPIYLNSPMAIEATKMTSAYVGELSLPIEQCQEMGRVSKYVTTVEESKHLNRRSEPGIIISASGMAEGGRVLHHLEALLPNPKNTILFVGFQAAGTRGEALIHGTEHVKIHGVQVPVRAEVCAMDNLSAHADANEIMAWLRNFSHPPKTTFVTHGEPHASEALRKRIQDELHWNSLVPEYQAIHSLS